MDRYLNCQAIVIKTANYKDNDLLITLLTKDHGKITAFAKGIKNIKSSRLGSLQLGNVVKTQLYHHHDNYWISEASSQKQFLSTAKNLTQINLLFYFLEIINNLIADEQQIDGIYDISSNIISSITLNKLGHFIYYEIAFINKLGFGVPDEIDTSYKEKQYTLCQKYIKRHLESIIDKPLNSNKLFS